MKNNVLLLVILFSINTFSQDKCYVQGVTQDVYQEKETNIVIKPSYKVFTQRPAEYKKIEQIVLVKEAYKKMVIIPEVWENKTVYYTKKEASSIIHTQEASLKEGVQNLMTHPEKKEWKQIDKSSDCISGTSIDDCKEWVYHTSPSETVSVSTTTIDKEATYTKNLIPKTVSVYNVKHLLEPAKVQEIEVPSVYDTIVKYALVKDASVEEIVIPAVYRKSKESVLVEKGGILFLKEIDCSLLEEQELKIEWDLKSAVLIPEAKEVIENKMIPFLRQHTNVKVEITSHTDDRGPEDLNLNLSERRSRAIVQYLISKGVDASLLEAKGMGESQPIFSCDENECTEQERIENRRVTYRLVEFIPNK